MKIEYEGRVYDYDLDDLDVKQAMAIEKHVGGTLVDWEKGLGEASLPCFQVLGWLILEGGDLSLPIGDVNFRLMKLVRAWSEASAAQAAEAEADPTTPGGSSTPATPASTPSLTGQPGSSPAAPASTTASGQTG